MATKEGKQASTPRPVDMSVSLKDEFVETTVGFNTSTKVAFQVVGNNATEGL